VIEVEKRHRCTRKEKNKKKKKEKDTDELLGRIEMQFIRGTVGEVRS
jgi:hypothetical protein